MCLLNMEETLRFLDRFFAHCAIANLFLCTSAAIVFVVETVACCLDYLIRLACFHHWCKLKAI